MESYQNNPDNNDEGINFEGRGIKCGEIFTTQSTVFNVLCTFCGTILKGIEGFTIHFKTNHNNQFENNLEIKVKEFPIIETDPIGQNEYETINTLHQGIPKYLKKSTDIVKNIDKVKIELYEHDSDTSKIRKNIDKSSLIHSDDSKEKRTFDDPSKQLEKNSNNNKISMIKSRKKTLTSHACDICYKEFRTKTTLKRHIISHHSASLRSVSSEKNTKQIKTSSPLDSLQSVDEMLMKCRFCYRKFRDQRKRYEHECLHTGEKTHKCNLCEKKFRTLNRLNEHLRVHENKREFKCEICGVGFNCKANLKLHIRRHNNDKPHKCSFCEKTFISSTTKKHHERTHTGERPYQCAECGHSFLSGSQLGVHIRRRHVGEKAFKCEHCNKEFVMKQSLKRHQVIHNKDERPFKCDVCDATFQRRNAFSEHKKLHSDEFRYTCNICGKGFKQFAGLYSHKKSHGENVAFQKTNSEK